MSTEFINDQWRLPNAWNGSESNVNKQSNYSMDFDGSQYIDCGDVPLEGVYTISFWINPDVSPSVLYFLFDKRDGFSTNISARVTQSSNNTIRFQIGTTNFSSTDTLTSNSWNNVVLIANGSSSKIYINNGTAATGTLATAPNTTDSFFIGTDNAQQSAYFFNGQIDAVSIFNYALSSSQVTTLYGSSSTGIGNPMSLSPKPVFYAPLGDQDSFNGASYLTPNSSLKDFVFDFTAGLNEYINLGNNSVLQPASNYTFSIWFNADSYSYKTIFGSNTSISSGVLALPVSNNTMTYYHATSTTTKQFNISLTDSPINNWHNFTITWSASTGIIRAFINGKFKAELTGVNDINWGNELLIGRYHQTYPFLFEGKLSNFAMWNTTLTDGFSGTPTYGDVAGGQVAEVYNNGSPQTTITGTPVGWWKLDASDTYDSSTGNWTIEDHAGSNDGTSSGMTQANLVQSDLSFTSGYSPYGLRFDGTNEKIEYTNGTIDLGLSSTETWWIKYSNSSATSSTIASAPVFAGFHILYEKSTNKIYYRIDSTNLYYEWLIPSTYFTDNLWHHYAIVRDDSLAFSSYIKLYIDGNLFGSPTAVNATTKSTTNTKITDWGGASAYSGIVADFSNIAVWNISLSSTEVQEIFNSGVPSNLNNFSGTKPYSWWQLGSNMSYNSNWTILDEGTGNNNGDAFNISEDSIVDGVGSYANGLSSGMGGDEIIGSAPFSDSNSLSVNMDALDRTDDTPN